MKTVLAAGVFDFFHPGHRFFLSEAKKIGDKLVVIIARDTSVERIKKIIPQHNEHERKKMVEEAGIADKVILGNEGENFLEVVKKINPDILALGYDQKAPKGFEETFLNTKIIQLQSKNPEEWKSSKFRN